MVAEPASGAAECRAAEPPGDLSRRPERAEDACLLLDIFRDTRGAMLAGLEPGLRDQVLRHQLAGQAMSYRARFPEACFDIVELAGTAIGRIVEDRTPNVITIVDIALLAAWRGRGIGTRLLREILASAGSAAVRLSVDSANIGARRLYERLGFAITARSDSDLTMECSARG